MQLITPPVGPVVALQDLREHLRVDGTDEDALIVSLEAAAVAYLDGWGGVLGRAIKEQTWAFQAIQGDIVSPLPDVISATQDGQPITVADDVLTVPADGEVRITCALNVRYLPKVHLIVKMLVAHWYDNRSPVSDGTMQEVPMAADALITSMRWGHV